MYNVNSGYGQAFMAALHAACPTFGRVHVVMNSGDTDESNYQVTKELFDTDPEGRLRFYTDLSDAYDAVESNNNDFLILDANSSHELDTMLTISKNRLHIRGLDYLITGGKETGQRTKVKLSTTGNAAAVAATLYVTGVGVTIKGLKIMNSGTNAASKAAFIDKGEACQFAHNSFAKFTDLNEAAVSDVIASGDSTTWEGNEFGFDTLTQSAARATVLIDGYGGGQHTHNVFKNNHYTCQSSEATKVHIKVADTAALRYESKFIDEIFTAAINSSNSAVTLTNAVQSASGLVEGNLLFVRPATTTTNFCAGTTDNVKVVAPVASNNSLEAVTPA